MKKILLFTCLFCCFLMNSQNSKIDSISLEHNGGIYVGPNSRIFISIMSTDVRNKYMDVFVKVDKKEFKTQISLEKFDAICEKLSRLKPEDIIKDAQLYLDSTNTELSFRMYANSVSFSVSGLDKNDEKTSRKDFLEVVKMILEIANVKIPYVN